MAPGRLRLVAVQPRVFEFEVTVNAQRASRSALGGSAIVREDEGWPEHLVLAALGRGTLPSMDYSARGAGPEGEGRARGTVTKRERDGLYAFVDIESHLGIRLDPPPEPSVAKELVTRAER